VGEIVVSGRVRRTVTGAVVAALLASGAPEAAAARDCLAGPVADRYAAVGGPAGRLGQPTSCLRQTPDLSGVYATFERGSIYSTEDTGAWDVSGAFGALWSSTGWETGFLGYPASGEEPARAGGVFQEFEGGTTFWTPATGAQAVSGDVEGFYAGQGWEWGFLGYPTSPERSLARGDGAYQFFQGGSVYTSAASGTHSVSGAFRGLYDTVRWEQGFLGYPTSQESRIRDGGAYQKYQGGIMYWAPATGAHSVSGPIRELYGSSGYENGYLGYPTSQEFPTLTGSYQRFQGGVAYQSPSTGPNAVAVPFLGLYAALGYENGMLRFPRSAAVTDEDGTRSQSFEGGTLVWSPSTGAHSLWGTFRARYLQDRAGARVLGLPTTQEVRIRDGGTYQAFQRGTVYLTWTGQYYAVVGAILAKYGQTGYENGFLGYPTSDEFDIPGGRRTNFEHGYIEWSAATGARVNAPIG
jgi:uncharacterized protein with LGFP repeats